MALRTYDCVFCLGNQTMEMNLDKKGRPYVRCWSCGAMTFIISERSFVGLNIFGGMVAGMAEKVGARMPDLIREARRNLEEIKNGTVKQPA